MKPWEDGLRRLFEATPPDRWLFAAATFTLVLGGFGLVRRAARKRLERAEARSTRRLVLEPLTTLGPLPATLIGAGAAASLPELPPLPAQIARAALVVGIGLQIGLALASAVAAVIERETARRRSRSQSGLASLGIFRLIGQVLVWSVVLLVVLSRLGVDVTALVASLGVGGIAVALAAQNILGDLFASLSIVLDRPFEVGDFIVVGSEVGTVQSIGLKTTRVKALSGEEIVVGNADLLGSRVRNFRRMEERRVVVRFGVLYGSDPRALRSVPELCRRAVERHAPKARFDRAHLDTFAPSSLDFELVYYLGTNDYLEHMDVKQAILLELFEGLPRLGLAFAFPTQTIHLESAA
jgi:small-conductance mechanosensitive channel